MNKPIQYDEKAVFAIMLRSNPGVVFETADGSLFKFDKLTNKVYYRKPSNKCRNKWYIAHGLNLSYQRISDMLRLNFSKVDFDE